MSFVGEDWKLKAQVVVKLRRENTNMLVSQSLSLSISLKNQRCSNAEAEAKSSWPRQGRCRPHVDISE